MLDWQPGETKYYQMAGAYKVCANRVKGVWHYAAYFRKELLDVKHTVEEARLVCNIHWEDWNKNWKK